MNQRQQRGWLGRAFLSSAVFVIIVTIGCTIPEVRKADKLAAQGRWDEAVEAYRQAQKKAPFDPAIQTALEQAKARAAEQHYTEGRRFLKENRLAEALSAFKQALGLDPSRAEHHAALHDALRLKEAHTQLQTADKLRGLGRLEEALDAYERAVELDPSLLAALEGITTLTQQQRAATALGGSSAPLTLRFQNAKLKEVFEILARAGGINVLFDKEVRDEPVTIFIKDTPFEQALNLILSLNALAARRIGPDTLLILPNTKPKQDQYQDLMIRTFYLSTAKAKDLVNLVRTMLESKRVYVNEPINALVIRDTPVKLQLAERIILANDRREAEVELDLEVLEVNRTKSEKLGVNFAKSAGFAVVPPGFTGGVSTNTTNFTYQQLTDLGPQSFLLSLPASVLLDFFKQDSDAKTLANPKLRVLNNRSASINIGDKQPILLSTTNVLPGQAATGAVPTTSTVTSIEFKDTGIKLTVEPTIHLVDELTLKLKIEVTRLGDLVTLQSNPLIQQFRFGTRTAETILTMKNDESVILAGLIQDEERKTRQTVPGLGDIPVLGALFSTTTTDIITTEVVLTITPRIVRSLPLPELSAQAFWSGTETVYATSPLFASAGPSSLPPALSPPVSSLPAPRPSAAGRSTPEGAGSAGAMGAAGVTPPAAPAEIAAGPVPTLAFRPPDLATALGQEFRLDLTSTQLEGLSESLVTIAFDPQALEFRRAAPAAATLTASTSPGQVALTLRPQAPTATGSGVLATLVFQAKTPGDFPITLQQASVSGAAGKTIAVTTERTLVHVR